MELFLWGKQRNITLWNATLFGNLQEDFHLEEKKKVEMMDVLTSDVLSHFHIVSTLLSLKSILAPFARRGFIRQCYEKLHIDQFWVLKGLNQSNKIGMLHKIRQKCLISLMSPSPSPRVLPCCFIQDVLPNPPSPFIFHIDWNT